MEIDLFLISGDNFYDQTKVYLEKLLSIPVKDESIHTIVMHNAFEPFNPWRPIKYFRDAKCIVVDRDPRDIYVTALQYSEGFNDYPNIYSKISCAFNVEYFIKRFKILMKNTKTNMDPRNRVLRIHFEDIVMKYEDTLKTIYEFLGEDENTHIKKKKFFDPAVSKKNIGLWKSYSHQNEIELITKELEEFCYA